MTAERRAPAGNRRPDDHRGVVRRRLAGVPDSPLLYSGSTPTERCQCPQCGSVFSTDTNFDRHQRLREDGVECLDPVGVGLVSTGGVWHRPGPPMPIEGAAVRISATFVPRWGDDLAQLDQWPERVRREALR
jgi:hypothetical protein